jgi:hypothetical protein
MKRFPISSSCLSLLLVVAALPSPSMAYPGAPSSWGTWSQDVYLGITPRQISATTDPDGRLRATFVNSRAPAVDKGFRQMLMFTYRRADAAFRQSEAVSFYAGLPFGTAFTNSSNPDFMTTEAMNLPLRTKVLAVSRSGGFDVRAIAMASEVSGANGLGPYQFSSRLVTNPSPWPLFPRLPWGTGPGNTIFDPIYQGNDQSRATSIGLSSAGEVLAVASRIGSELATAQFSLRFKIGTQTLDTEFVEDFNYNGELLALVGRIRTLDTALSDDGKDCYLLLNTALPLISPTDIVSGLQLIRQRLALSPLATTGVLTRAPIVNISNGRNPPYASVIADAKVHLTRATGEPKWITWTDTENAEIRVAKRLIPLPGAPGSDDTNQNRRINAGYEVLPPLANFSFGCDAALDRLDRLHVVWWTPVGGLVHYARETSSGTFEQITLPTLASGSPAIAIGPGDYPYIMYAGATTANPGESAPLIVTVPPGLLTAYRGDYEDRDEDGRCGLIERAQGSSDTYAETSLELRALSLATVITTVSPGVRRFETGFQLNTNAIRVSGTTTWNLADGNDTIQIQPTYSINGMRNFYSGGFNFVDEFVINGRGRYATVQDTASVTSFPRQFYRLLVTRIPGAP